MRLAFLLIVLVLVAMAPAAFAQQNHEAVVKIVAQIQRADYEGDRPALAKLFGSLQQFITDEKLASRVRYWRGFALWRRAINGFNESADPKDLEHDLTQAAAEFKESSAGDPIFVDAKIGGISCYSTLAYLAIGNATRMQELIVQSSALVKEAKAADPDNPRLLWVLGPILWNLPAERGGGQEKAIEGYKRGLESARKRSAVKADPLDPSWGEPELLMSLAWSYLNQTSPDVDAAEKSAQAALAIVPYWHYVRDILMPQIQKAKAKN